ncbi:MAG: leucyl aminopeptidase family protein [Oscillospiraceae bacterium]
MKVLMGCAQPSTAATALFCAERPFSAPYSDKIEALIGAGRFSPERDEVKVTEQGDRLLLLMGRPQEDDVRHLMKLIGTAVGAAKAERAATLALDLTTYRGALELRALIRLAVIAALEADYRFDEYKSEKKQDGIQELLLSCGDCPDASLQQALSEGILLGEAVCAVRGVVNRTSRDMTPARLAAWAAERAEAAGCEVEILGPTALEQKNAKALLSVSAGAVNPPAMVILRYRGNPEQPEEITALLGKGITYDSGGLSLKSKTGMITMHHDMGGAAAAAAACSAAARMKAKINLTAVLPICENMLSPTSYRPGDVIGTMNGKTVLIKSTDAEGRLVLADAMTYAIRSEKARRILDIATLTGGAVAAYGSLINAIAVEDETLRRAAGKASETSGELVWEMPLLKDYMTNLKTDHADIANSSNGVGSAMINSAVFLREFTEGLPWLHIDCAGTAWCTKPEGCFSYGATGSGTVLLYDLIGLFSKP